MRPGEGWSGEEDRFLTLAEYDEGRRPYEGPRVEPEQILILVMASKSLEDRARLIDEGWSRSAVRVVYVVDEWISTVPREKQWLPSLLEEGEEEPSEAAVGKRMRNGGPSRREYWDAQTRQLEYMRRRGLHARASGLKWVILADDDTWVNVDALVAFVSGHDPEVPALFSYIWSDAHVLGYDYPCGGAGMLFSIAAYEALSPLLLTESCPLLGFNDMTLGYCAHALGVAVVHHHNMHCSPDVNRAMRIGENLLDLQRAISVHRLPAFGQFSDMMGTLATMDGQLRALLREKCRLAARSTELSLDLRRFYWSLEAFAGAVDTCRAGAPTLPPASAALHLELLFFSRGAPVAHYHRDRRTPFVAQPAERAARWPEWLQQFRTLSNSSSSGGSAGDTWAAQWFDAVPRLSRVQVESTSLDELAATAATTPDALLQSFAARERQSPHGSWLEHLRRAVRRAKAAKRVSKALGRTWYFLDFAPATTFMNAFESLRVLRSVSDLYAGMGKNPYIEDVYSVIDLGAISAPPLALAYEYFNLNVEPDAGVFVNGVAAERLLRCGTQRHAITLDPTGHANDYETEAERLSLMWHNALAVDVFRILRFCGVITLHTPRMIPHALSYLPYSTYRRTHAPSVATAITMGNLMHREQLQSTAQLVSLRVRRQRRRLGRRTCPAPWRLPWRMRLVGDDASLPFTAYHWRLPGARFLGQSLVAFRSEHFIPDAQAVGSVTV